MTDATAATARLAEALPELFTGYDPAPFFCEMTTPRPGVTAASLVDVMTRLDAVGLAELKRRAKVIDRDLFTLGITFTVYSDKDSIDRVLPFDVIPRIIMAAEWEELERGIRQRVAAVNAFLSDIYGPQKILADGIVPREIVLGNAHYRKEMVGFTPRHGTWAHICGIDLIRDQQGRFLVLEDNCRTPSGVSYVLENRRMMMRAFPDVVAGLPLSRVSDYGQHLQAALAQIAPDVSDPQVVLLSPGIYNSAYFEHVFLAREMGVPLVEGPDLTVENDRVYMRTTRGLEPVHAIYRRIDDDFLDPRVFRSDSVLGVPGLVDAWRKGHVGLANAVGTGVADDKAIYAYMPRIIRYYLAEDAILPNVDTRICREPEALAYTLDHLDELVVKPVGESGGYGMLVGPKSTRTQQRDFARRLKAKPDNYISQPTIGLSVSPTLTTKGLAPRHLDLRPFAVTGKDTWVLPGGLTRVAMRPGSLVVNSSQGGGTKDTWVLSE